MMHGAALKAKARSGKGWVDRKSGKKKPRRK
jgi:hypothetical protein